MKKVIALMLLAVVVYPVSSMAFTGVSVGGKIGYANYTGDILPSSGDVGNSVAFGAVLDIETFPLFDLELHAGYFTKDFTYTYAVGGVPVSADFEFRDLNVLAVLKKNLINVPASPLGLYVGAGLGLHLINTEVAKSVTANPSLADNPFSLFSNSAKTSGHGLVGVKISPPLAPLALFGEARFGRIFTDPGINVTQIEAGVMLKF